MKESLFIATLALASFMALATESVSQQPAQPPLLREFQQEVRPRWHPPEYVVLDYAGRLSLALSSSGLSWKSLRYVLLVDRNPQVQAMLIFWGTSDGPWRLLGVTPVSTGLPGRFEYFETPLGVFDHSLSNPDFRAEGTLNEFGIRGYGRAGMRVYDFGWVAATRGWGAGGPGVMRLQMHATDPDRLEPSLGRARSKGCIRIPATLNDFIDRHGLLDEDYELHLQSGDPLWVLRADRRPTPWSGRYLVVIDSDATERPVWAGAQPSDTRP